MCTTYTCTCCIVNIYMPIIHPITLFYHDGHIISNVEVLASEESWFKRPRIHQNQDPTAHHQPISGIRPARDLQQITTVPM